MTSPDSFTAPQVCALVGITYRQVDYWARTGLVRPSLAEARGSGTQRRYSGEDVFALRVVKRLLDAGVSLQSVRSAVPIVGGSRTGYLVVGGGRAHLCGAEDLVRQLRGPVAVVVDLEGVRLEHEAALAELRPSA